MGLSKQISSFISRVKVQRGHSWLVGAAILHVSSPFKDPGCQNLCQLKHPHPSELEVGKTAWSARCRVLMG